MDGNNRWSKKKNISKFESYKQGANKLIEITNFIFETYELDYVSAFALSKHNFKRGSVLLDVIKKVLIDFLEPSKDINNFKYKIKFNGNLNFLPKNIVEKIIKLERKNPKSKKKLIIFLNYSGKDDILNAAKSISQTNSNKINHKIFQNFLIPSRIPDPEILVRTGGYKRLSDFMLYQISFTELFFINKLWPDIKINDVKKFIKQFNKIDRKFGN
tara:strand:+ start:1028 stop:1672 length:645 start_codon:yes stop_codon:yes gene_type:complete